VTGLTMWVELLEYCGLIQDVFGVSEREVPHPSSTLRQDHFPLSKTT
jgi:hypothetical protein